MERIQVRAASASYDVVVDAGAIDQAGRHIREIAKDRRLFVVADENAFRHQGARLEQGLSGLDYVLLPIALGEQRKRLAAVEELCERMHAAGADRSAVVVAFGGGIAGDVGGFVAASYMRGVDVVQVPTTLLAQVDAAVGGKTGVNLASGKNLVGAFHQPKLVLMDTSALSTLPDREYRAGLFEVVKHGIIRSPELFELMRDERERAFARDPEILTRMVAESVRIKAAVVEADEREGGLRRILNYGHTFGHALEAETGYSRLLHGEAVGWGMVAAGRMGEALGLIESGERRRIEEVVLSYGPIPSLEGLDAESIAARVGGDKKTVGGVTHFILPERTGRVTVVPGPPHGQVVAAIRAALDAVATVEA